MTLKFTKGTKFCPNPVTLVVTKSHTKSHKLNLTHAVAMEGCNVEN